jgi:hypothetical protein
VHGVFGFPRPAACENCLDNQLERFTPMQKQDVPKDKLRVK